MTAIAAAASQLTAAQLAQRSKLRERVLLDGQRFDADVTGRLLSARMVRAYDSATSIELGLDDHDFRILRSGLITKRGRVRQQQFEQAAWARFGDTRLVLDGIAFRLVGAEPLYNATQRQLTLTFEDELAVLLRRGHGPKRFRRGDWHKGYQTRATVLWNLITEALGDGSRFFTPELFDKQPIKGTSDREQAKARKKGLAHKGSLKVKGVRANAEQLNNMETVLTVADQDHAGERATLGMLVAAIGESSFLKGAAEQIYGTHKGVFQSNQIPASDLEGQAHHFLVGGRSFRTGGAIQAAKDHPDWTLGQIAQHVEISDGDPSYYDGFTSEAQAILDAWGGAGAVTLVTHPYYFTVAKDENFFDAAGRLAKDVRERFWIDQNQIWLAPDDWLFKSATTLTVSPATPGVFGFSGPGADVGVKLGELVVDANVARWVGSPAWRVEVDGMGPFNGLWLLARHEQDLLTEDSTITLHRPAPRLKEPAPKTDKTITDVGDAVPLDNVKARGAWGGTKAIFDQFVTPFMAARGLEPGNAKRTPAENAAAGGSSDSDHLTTNKSSYATDYPTFDGEQAARELAREMGYGGWKANSYTRFDITVNGKAFSVQILWGAGIDHGDHVHVGIHPA